MGLFLGLELKGGRILRTLLLRVCGNFGCINTAGKNRMICLKGHGVVDGRKR